METEKDTEAGVRLKLKCDPRQLQSERVSKKVSAVECSSAVDTAGETITVKKAVEPAVITARNLSQVSAKSSAAPEKKGSGPVRRKKKRTEAEKNYYRKLYLTLFVFLPLFLLLALFIFCGAVSICLVGRVAANPACGDLIHAAALELKERPVTQWWQVAVSAADKLARESAVPASGSTVAGDDGGENTEETVAQ